MQANGQHAASPFMNSPALPGAMPQASPDKECPPSPWNFNGLALPSRTVTPAPSAGRDTPPQQITIPLEHFQQLMRVWASMSAGPGTPSSSSPAPSNASSFSPSQTQLSLSRPATPDVPKSKRIPRPPNAFMLYRSHLLKTRQIPPNVEHRQQNISRVAGQCWNMLSDEEKKTWHAKAKEVLSAHMAKYPGYKFSPERKNSRRKTPQDTDAPVPTGDEWIVHLRKTYMKLDGPAPQPSRDRRNRSRRGVGTDQPASISLPPSLEASPASSPGTAPNLSAPASVSSSPAMRPFSSSDMAQWGPPFDMPLFPDVPPPQQLLDQFALPTGQASAVDNDVTPRAATFGDIAPPPEQKYNYQPMFDFSAYPGAESHLGLQNLALPESFTGGLEPGPSGTAASQPPVDDIWSLINDPNASGSLHGDEYPYASHDFAGPVNFDDAPFASLFSGSD